MEEEKGLNKLPIFPLMEVFGGTLGVLLLLLMYLILQQDLILQEQRDPKNIGGITQMSLDSVMTWHVLSCFKDSIRIEETKQIYSYTELLEKDNEVVKYCKKIYEFRDERRICAFIYPESNNIIMRLEEILFYEVPNGKDYNFIVINDEIMEDLERIADDS